MLSLNKWNKVTKNEKSQWGCLKKLSLHPLTETKEKHKNSWI